MDINPRKKIRAFNRVSRNPRPCASAILNALRRSGGLELEVTRRMRDPVYPVCLFSLLSQLQLYEHATLPYMPHTDGDSICSSSI